MKSHTLVTFRNAVPSSDSNGGLQNHLRTFSETWCHPVAQTAIQAANISDDRVVIVWARSCFDLLVWTFSKGPFSVGLPYFIASRYMLPT